MRTVTFLRRGNRLAIEPTTPKILRLLTPHLQFLCKRFLRGQELKLAIAHDRPRVEEVIHEVFDRDHKGRLATLWGFYEPLRDLLQAAGYRTKLELLWRHPQPEIFTPYWDRVFDHFTLRAAQDDFLVEFFSHENGQIWTPPGWGKSFTFGAICMALPKARIDIVTKSVTVLCKRLYPALCRYLPSVGIVGGGLKRKGQRVMLYTLDSLHHSGYNADLVLVDEVHRAAADNASERLANYESARMWGASASLFRDDNKHKRTEGLFGPVRFNMTYAEAVARGLVLPIQIRWRRVPLDNDPSRGYNMTERQRWGIWRNHHRNHLIRDDARRYGDDVQVLICCETVEHAVNLKALLPEYTLAYREHGLREDDRRAYVEQNLLSPDEPEMTWERRDRLTDRFERGKLRKVIVTTIWNEGVSMNNLQVLIRADAGDSTTTDIQIPGRTSRHALTDDVGKNYGIVHDYSDDFSRYWHGRAKSRSARYVLQEWEQLLWQIAARKYYPIRHL